MQNHQTIASKRYRWIAKQIYLALAVTALPVNSATANEDTNVLNLTRSVGDAVGCMIIPEEDGRLVFRDAEAAFLRQFSSPNAADFDRAFDEGVQAGRAGLCDLFKEHPEIGRQLQNKANTLKSEMSNKQINKEKLTVHLLDLYRILDALCRGGAGDQNSTTEACSARQEASETLKDSGFCFVGSGAGSRWEKCSP